jgi:ribosome-binding protein aMBF1 (putative translation factor)
MSEKMLKVCDACGKQINGQTATVKIGETEYKEVCPACIGRLGTFVKRLGTPYVYKSKKGEKTEPAAAAEPAAAELAVEPKTADAGKSALGFGGKGKR